MLKEESRLKRVIWFKWLLISQSLIRVDSLKKEWLPILTLRYSFVGGSRYRYSDLFSKGFSWLLSFLLILHLLRISLCHCYVPNLMWTIFLSWLLSEPSDLRLLIVNLLIWDFWLWTFWFETSDCELSDLRLLIVNFWFLKTFLRYNLTWWKELFLKQYSMILDIKLVLNEELISFYTKCFTNK